MASSFNCDANGLYGLCYRVSVREDDTFRVSVWCRYGALSVCVQWTVRCLLPGVWSEYRGDAREGLCVTPTVTPERKLDVATGRVVPLRCVQIKRLSATHRKGTVRLAVSGHHFPRPPK